MDVATDGDLAAVVRAPGTVSRDQVGCGGAGGLRGDTPAAGEQERKGAVASLRHCMPATLTEGARKAGLDLWAKPRRPRTPVE